MRRLVFGLLTTLLAPLVATAQVPDQPNTILVLDGSGSMWGQIDGVNKIVIAREVIADLLADMPDDQSLGLTVYGHRERGSCTDIETIVAPGPFTQDAILEAVNGINPRGRTPMTDSVIAAARALRHTEEAATVILVSDGIENCNPDPCAIAAELEATGIGFTAHVIGFDVAAEPEARAQMQCIAENTGGLFLTADNAEELADALTQVAAAPVAQPVQIEARVTPGGTAPVRPIDWTILDTAGGVVSSGAQGAATALSLPPGDYLARATRAEATGPVAYQTAFTIGTAPPDAPVIVEMPALSVEITFTARIGSDAGALVTDPVVWEISGQAPLDATENPLAQGLDRGAYTVTAFWTVEEVEASVDFVVVDQPREITVVFPTPAVSATLVAPATAVAGSTIEVGWDAPPVDNDFIGVGPVGADGADRHQNFTYVRGDNPVELLVPPAAGDYVIRYFRDRPREALSEVPLTVTPVTATLTGPDTAEAGSTVEIGWTGPDYRNDFVAIGPVDARGGDRWVNFTYTNRGNPTELLMPTEPGEYLVRYIMDQDRTEIASMPITVTPVSASLTAPETAVAGSTIEVGWTGPDNRNDFIAIGPVDARGGDRWINFTYTNRGNPTELLMPTEPGEYLIRYILDQDRVEIAAVPITVTPVGATLTAPQSAVAGSVIEVGWTGPDNRNDFIAIGAPDARGSDRWVNFTYTNRGNPTELQMPTAPGDYLIRYILDQDRVEIASVPITVTAVTATLTAPETAVAGSTIEVGWTGPDYRNDFVAIGPVDARGSDRWINFTYTNRGNPTELQMPTAPGDYLIRYILDQDRIEIASVSITVTPVSATLTAPATAAAGSTIEVGWTGPDYRNDFIGIGPVGATRNDRWDTFTYTNRGNPTQIAVPETPGDYLIRYIMDQDRVSIAEIPLRVE